MESISIVPSTVLNSIYVNERKNCTGGSIVLEDRYTVYFMQITDTTNISIDSSLLNIPTNCSLQFKLVVWSDKANVLNFSGCSIEQIEVKRGESIFIMQWTQGSNVWSVIPDVLSGYAEVSLPATSFPQTMCRALARTANLKFQNQYQNKYFSAFSLISPYNLNDNNWCYGPCDSATNYSAYVWSIKPFMIRNIQIHWGASWGSIYFPETMSVYGSNDNINWTAIATNVSLVNTSGRYNQNIAITGANNFYKAFRFDFNQTSGSDANVPPISILGYEGTLIDNFYYDFLMPKISAASDGYDVSSNSSAMSSTSGSVYNLLNETNQSYTMVRSDTSTNWEIVYTMPEAKKICGIYLQTSLDDQSPTLLTIYGSADSNTWTQISKLDDNALYQAKAGYNEDYVYLFNQSAAYRYYKIVASASYSGTYFTLRTLQLITKKPSAINEFDTIIPALSSNSQDGYVVSCTNTDDGPYYQLFDGNPNTLSSGHYDNGEWSINIQLPTATAINGICLISRMDNYYYQAAYAFTVQGSNDNDTWTVLDTENLGSSFWQYKGQLATFTFANTTAYLYYRIVCTASGGNGEFCGFGEVGLTTNGAMPNVNWTEDIYVVPVMASDSQDGYVASASTYYSSSYAPWKAFDRTANASDDCWATLSTSDGSGNCDEWLQIQLPTAQIVNILNLVAKSGYSGQMPRDFTFEGSNNGTDWTTLLTQTDQSYENKTWEFTNSTAYLYYRLATTKIAAGNSNPVVFEMNLIERITHTN